MIAIVTGGATGIGFGIVCKLASVGMQVAIVQPALEQAERAAEQVPGCIGFAADVRDPDAVERMTNGVVQRFGGLDLLVNNAAITGHTALAPFLEASRAHVNDVLDVNLKGAIWCSQAAARHMAAAGSPGNIVHIASVGAYAAQFSASVYCASKAALVALTRSMALELAPHRIRVNAVAPGDIFTEASADVATKSPFSRRTPLGRRGTPEDIGEAVAYLASDAASFVTGSVLTVDGGYLAY